MSYVQLRNRYPFNSYIQELESIETSSRNRILSFEISTLKNNEKFNKTLSALNENKEQFDTYSSKIKGFNYWAAFLALSFTHYFILFKKKKLLYEFKSNQILSHLGIVTGSAVASGVFFGSTMSYNFSLYWKYYKTRRNMNRLIHDFITTYNPQTILKPLH